MNEQESVSGDASLSSGDASLPLDSFMLMASANDIIFALEQTGEDMNLAYRVRILSQRKTSRERMN